MSALKLTLTEKPFVLSYGDNIACMDKAYAEKFISESLIAIAKVKSGSITGVDLQQMQSYHDRVCQHLEQLS